MDRDYTYENSVLKLMVARSSDLSKILDANKAKVAVLGSDVIEEKYSDKYIEEVIDELYVLNENGIIKKE